MKKFYLPILASVIYTAVFACAPSENKPHDSASSEPSQTKESNNSIADADKALWDQAKNTFAALPERIPAPAGVTDTPELVALGKQLFHDPRLSKSGAISCNSCHNLASGGVDNRPFSLGHGFKQGGRNSPTVLNAGLHTAQFWDLRAKDLTEQAKGPVLNPVEMAMASESDVVTRLESIDGYQKAFKAAFKGSEKALSYQNMAEAIAAFERILVTPSRFDQFLNGKGDALSADEKIGLQTFMAKGCSTCHSGVAIGGGMAQKMGVVKPYANQKDLGRFDQSKKPEDKFVFKVPSLRNIAHTYPYFHDGAVWDLKESIKIMGEIQLGQNLSAQEVDSIATFLNALSGELSAEAKTLPELPVSGPKTSKPAI